MTDPGTPRHVEIKDGDETVAAAEVTTSQEAGGTAQASLLELDHTSALKLLEEKWNLPARTARDAVAASPLGALDLTGPPPSSTRGPCPNPA
jgi:hypothetical protein